MLSVLCEMKAEQRHGRTAWHALHADVQLVENTILIENTHSQHLP
jgi:hypothetical protein